MYVGYKYRVNKLENATRKRNHRFEPTKYFLEGGRRVSGTRAGHKLPNPPIDIVTNALVVSRTVAKHWQEGSYQRRNKTKGRISS